MEHSSVQGDLHSGTERVSSQHAVPQVSSFAAIWGTPQNAGTPSSLFAQMQEVLGENAAPDAQFFVDSWTLGVETAAHRSQARRNAAAQQNLHASSLNLFDFSAPLNFVEDAAQANDAFTTIPAGFAAAWKDAYGIHEASWPHSSTHDAPQTSDQAPSSARTSCLPVTLEEAYQLLGVTATSTRKQIKAAYRQLVWRYHPDRLAQSSEQERRTATDQMTSINEAYHLLCGSDVAAAS